MSPELAVTDKSAAGFQLSSGPCVACSVEGIGAGGSGAGELGWSPEVGLSFPEPLQWVRGQRTRELPMLSLIEASGDVSSSSRGQDRERKNEN